MNNRTDIWCDGNVKPRAIGAPAGDLTAALHIERGCLADYHGLAGFHYRSTMPRAVTSVFRLVHRGESCIDRFLGRPARPQIIGVLVRALPPLACALRDVATGDRYARLAPSK